MLYIPRQQFRLFAKGSEVTDLEQQQANKSRPYTQTWVSIKPIDLKET